MQNFDVDPKSKKGIRGLLIFVICMALIAAGLIVALVLNSQSALHSFAAQENPNDHNTESNEPLISSPTTQVIDLVSLLGLSRDEAIERIGHGATVQDQETLSSFRF